MVPIVQPPHGETQMTMTQRQYVFLAPLSANESFKLKYPRYLKLALLLALIITALLLWLWPDVQPNPYRLRQSTEMVWYDIPDPMDIPEPPQPVQAPRLPPVIEAVPEEDPNAIDPNWEPVDFWEPSPPPAATGPEAYDGFRASSALPRITYQAKADYPEIARRSGLEGTVMFKALVDPLGQVDQVMVVNGVHPLLDRAALDAARKCRFTPAKQRELKVQAWVAIPYRFRLR